MWSDLHSRKFSRAVCGIDYHYWSGKKHEVDAQNFTCVVDLPGTQSEEG